jgi:quercetin dioxygenase-like cupin family protein
MDIQDQRVVDGTESELDGVLADPTHHRVLLDDGAVRVVQTRISAGEETPVHVHPHRRLVIVLSGTSFARHDVHGNELETTNLADHGRVMWAEPTDRHSITNTGPDDLDVIAVEFLGGNRAHVAQQGGIEAPTHDRTAVPLPPRQ